ncbi:MAG TPA: YraN family protein [Gammaproteobacteria bacterium]|nr:YraN family protein [Fuerstiella sp.]MCP4926866.1 YraN family protein [Gammaproteobacteria bacterium]MDP7295899.1 YraN family protein [Gammaproteobacteria bacterium]MDP7660632.1 YraN family protein [Gammaproteobacteria bacterium]HJP37968.1 YraN family protein [Gammaproteobacteria bacterium]
MAQHINNGRTAEKLARRFLTDRGLTVVTTNYHCRYGELDLVMCQAELLIIVEIRYRQQTTFGGPIASIATAKQRKIAIATQHFLRHYPTYRDAPVRFDVVGLTGTLHTPDIDWITGAFTMDDLTDT